MFYSRRHWCFLAASSMIRWRSFEERFWNIDNFDGNFFIFIVFDVLTSDSLMFPCCFVDDSLMIFSEDTYLKLWHFRWNFFDLYCFCFVKLWIIDVWLLLQWWFVDDILKEHWWHYEDLDANAKDHWSL